MKSYEVHCAFNCNANGKSAYNCECNIDFYCTLKNDIARGASTECNIIFQRAIQNHMHKNQSAIYLLSYAYCSFKLDDLII